MIPRQSSSTHIQPSHRTRSTHGQQTTQTPPRPSQAHRTSTPTLSRPSSTSGTSRQRPLASTESMEPISPTPRKATRRGRRAGAGPSQAGKGGEDGWEDTNTAGEEELFGLLGVINPPIQPIQAQKEGEKGVLAISKADIEASSGATPKKTRRGRRHDPNYTGPAIIGVTDEHTSVNSLKKDNRRGARGPKAAVIPDIVESTTQSESDTPAPASEATPQKPPRTRQPKAKTKTPSKPISALSAQIASHPNPQASSQHLAPIPVPSASSSTFEFSSLSRSLPSEAMFVHPPPPSSAPPFDQHKADEVGRNASRKQKSKGRKKVGDSEDESKVWDEPMDPGPAVAEDLTWQQRLGSYPNADSPSRSNPSSNPKKPKVPHTTSRPSPLNPRPTHSRRSSADALSLPSHNRHTSFPTTTTTSSSRGIPKPPPSAYPLSSFDTLPPFNPALNVHRAPQTPAKNGLASKYAVMELPIKSGSFPRINGSGSQGMSNYAGEFGIGGMDAGKYAGASFHNSPHGRALPKPDMEDF